MNETHSTLGAAVPFSKRPFLNGRDIKATKSRFCEPHSSSNITDNYLSSSQQSTCQEQMHSGAWLLWASPQLYTILLLVSAPLQALKVSATTKASTSPSDTSSPLHIITVSKENPPFSLFTPLASPSALFNITEPSNNIRFTCNADAYGSPNLQSCIECWNLIAASTDVVNFGERDAPEDWDVVVPYRFISGEQRAAQIS